jgi:predicted nucleic acid-binding protein
LGRLDLPDGSRVYLDTAPIIYSVEEHTDYWHLLKDIWASLDSGSISVVTSELSLLETLVKPISERNNDLVTAYETLLTDFRIDLIPISNSHLREAAALRAKFGFKTPDAIHAATAESAGCSHLIANDSAFRRLDIIKVLILSDLI